MKALTICQPWAWAIAEGLKTVENRNWPTNWRGPLLIHAGKSRTWDVDGRKWIAGQGIDVPEELEYGAILGACELVDCVRYGSSPAMQRDPWASGPWCWVLKDFRPLVEPLPWTGAQGLFAVELPAAARFR